MSTAVSNAGRLKPEIRLAQALSEYCACLGESRAREFKSLRTTSPPTPQDVITLTEEINRDGSRKHRAWRPYATRMAMFLDKVQTLSRIGDFLVGSSQNLMASGIWATVKITLGIAVGSLSFFKRISELFLKVERSSSITRDLVEVFPNSKDLQHLMCEYLVTLVSFCKDVVQVLKKPTILQLSSPFIAFFDKEASKFETELTQLSTAIDRKVAVLMSQSQVDSANTISRIGRTLSQWPTKSEAKNQQALALRSSRLQDKLSPPTDQHQRIAAWRRQRKKGDVHWLFKEQGYLEWLLASVGSGFQARVLLVRGKLGSGKTVLLANMVAELYALRTATELQYICHKLYTITYFFCDHDYADLITPEKILGSIFQQIVASLKPDDKCVVEMDKLFQRSGCSFPSLHKQASVLASTWPQECSVYIVIDGLDRCKNSVVEQVIHVLLGIAKGFLPSRSCSWIHLCFSSRIDTPIKKLLSRGILPSMLSYEFAVNSAASKTEMRSFVEAEFERRRDIRNLDKDLEDIIRDVLPSDILMLLESPPKDLAEAFNNALDRISDTRYGKTIFQLIATARRPLTISELKIALHVKPGDTDWTSIALSLPQDERAIVGLCGGGLVEIDEEDNTVRFIHHSVVQHLQQPVLSERQPTRYHFHKHEADIHMGFVCTTYLNYTIFNTSLSTISKTVVSPDRFTHKIAEAVGTGSARSTRAQVASKVIDVITRRRNPNRPGNFSQENIKIGQILQRYIQPKVESSDIMAFSEYAHDHWVWHSNLLWVKSGSDLYRPFELLLRYTPDHVNLPWNQAWGGNSDTHRDRDADSLYYSTIHLPLPPERQLMTCPMEEGQLRWAQTFWHFGILFDVLGRLHVGGLGLENKHTYRPRLRRIFCDVADMFTKSPESLHLFDYEPAALFEKMFRAAFDICSSSQEYDANLRTGLQDELYELVEFNGLKLMELPEIRQRS